MTAQDDALRTMARDAWLGHLGPASMDALVALLQRYGDAVRAETVARCIAVLEDERSKQYVHSALYRTVTKCIDLLAALERGELDEP